jgi:ketosteroid isomerase-like protein
MSERERNQALLAAGIEAYNRGDFEAMAEFFDPAVECHIASGLGNPGTWHGLDGFREMNETRHDAFAEDLSEVISASMPDDNQLIAEMRQIAVGSGSGVPVEMTNVYLLEIRDGRAVRFHIYADREAAMAAVR